MKSTLLILSILLSLRSIGQDSSDIRTAGACLSVFKKLVANDSLATGDYYWTDGLGGNKLSLYCDKKYEIMIFDCLSRDISISSTWEISSTGKVVLESKNSVDVFQFFDFQGYYFLIPQEKVEQFAIDFKKSQLLVGKREIRFKIGERTYTNNDLLATHLRSKYYCRDTRENTRD